MSAQFLMVTQVAVRPGALERTAGAWRRLNAAAGADAQLYSSVDSGNLMELRSVPSLAELPALREQWAQLWSEVASDLAGDFHRQLLEFVEAPKPTDRSLPDTPYVQLRRVEVKPPVHEQYLDWRRRTIFQVANAAEESQVFLCYHSLVSTDPGVLFVVGFSVAPKEHDAIYRTPAYEDILVQARENYIVPEGGDAGLFLESYARLGD